METLRLEEAAAFVQVVRAGGFSAAERMVGVSKSTLSKQVWRLEEELGVRLLQRTTRKVALTDAGRAYYERCSAAVDAIIDANRVVRDATAVPRGRLRVSSVLGLGDILAQAFVTLRARYPEVEVELVQTPRKVDLVAEGFDVALRGGILDDSTLVARKLIASTGVLVASPDYLDRRGCPEVPEDLGDHDLISHTMITRWELAGPKGSTEVTAKPWMTSNEWPCLIDTAIRGGGIALLLSRDIFDAVADGRLVRVLPEHSLQGGGLYAVYPTVHHLTPKVRVFVDVLAEIAGELTNELSAWS